MSVTGLHREYLAPCSSFLVLQTKGPVWQSRKEEGIMTRVSVLAEQCSRAPASKCNLGIFLRKQNDKGIFLFTVKKLKRAGEPASVFWFLDSFRMQFSGGLKDISSAAAVVWSFLDFSPILLQMRVLVMFKKMWTVWMAKTLSYFLVNEVYQKIKHQAVNQQIEKGPDLFFWFF